MTPQEVEALWAAFNAHNWEPSLMRQDVQAVVDAALAAERDLHLRFLLVAYDALGRAGWESGLNDAEARDAIFNHLCHHDCDPNLSPLATALRARGA